MALLNSRAKVLTLLGAFAAELSGGTNCAYGPQLATKFILSSTKINLVGGAGNCGMYLMGPPCGYYVDKVGPRAGLLSAGVALATGYFGVYLAYVMHDGDSEATLLTFLILAFCHFAAGTGGSMAVSSAGKAVTRIFDAEVRGTALAITVSGIGLSAFFYSTVVHAIAGNSTAMFLLILAIGCGASMLIGASLISTPPSENYQKLDQKEQTSPNPALETPQPMDIGDPIASSQEMLLPLSESTDHGVHGLRLFKNTTFLYIFLYAFFITGSGLQYINNIGTVVYTLSSWQGVDPKTAALLQARQISVLSICNCTGRLVIGMLSDRLRNNYNAPRVTCLIIVSTVMLLSQIVARSATSTSSLTFATVCLGFSYGGSFSLLPTLMAECFGIEHFASCFGFICLAPGIAGQLFNSMFGLIYDHHSDHIKGHQCADGLACYSTAFSITTIVSAVAVGLAIQMTRRDLARQKSHKRQLSGP